MEEKTSVFDQSLSNFMHDFASGGAIRHLADQGYTVTQIREKLLFPTPKDRVARTVWEHYLATGKIRLEEPRPGETIRKVHYVKEQGKYGKVSMRQVVEEITLPRAEYIPCDFGIRLRQNKERFLQELKGLTEQEKQLILDLPWPSEVVWYAPDERMRAIRKKCPFLF